MCYCQTELKCTAVDLTFEIIILGNFPNQATLQVARTPVVQCTQQVTGTAVTIIND